MAARSEVVSFGLNILRAVRARHRGLGHSEVDLTRARHVVLDSTVMAHTENEAAATLPGFVARLRQIVAICREHGIRPVLVTQPALFGDAIDPTTGVALSTVQVSGRGNGALEWRLLEAVNDATRRLAQAEQVLLIDLASELQKDSRFYYDFLHFTNEGAEQVGALVAAGLAPYLRQHFGARQASR
jgi:lysophospholipase L1-like esterase